MTIHQDGSWKLHGADVDGYYDHRMVLSFSVAGLNAEGRTRISDAQMLAKSFEAFIPNMQRAGADFTLIEEN